MTTKQIKKLAKRIEDIQKLEDKLIDWIIASKGEDMYQGRNMRIICAIYNNVTFRKSELILKYKYYRGTFK